MRHMKQARRVDNGELVRGFLFYMQYDGCEMPCIAIESLSANDYSEIYSSCYYEIDLTTVEDVAVKPIWEHYCWRCPNCKAAYSSGTVKYCADCGQRIDWSGEDE